MIKSILAGVMIAIGSLVYVNASNPIAGAFFFSIGLIIILLMNFNLYTGKIGYIRKIENFPSLLLIFLANLIGCCILFIVPKANADFMIQKISIEWYYVLGKAFICGVLVYIAVDQFKKGRIWITLLAIPAFIIAKCEHCIADFCYMILTRTFTWKSILFLLLVTIGNSIGALSFSILGEYTQNELCKNKQNRYSKWRRR